MPPAPDDAVVHDARANEFRIELGDAAAILAYRRTGETIVFVHTEVPESMRGHGLADRLAEAGLEFARAERLKVVAQCPFVAAYLRRHAEYADLVRHSTT